MPGKLMLITKPWLGHVAQSDTDFGRKMLVKFFHTLEDADTKPDAICFYTEGVKAVCEDFPAVGSLQALEKADVRIVICQTCLDYYGLMDKVSVGQVGGMDTIVSLITTADIVITP